MVFDSANPTGGDWDLGTPHQDFGGPGRGRGGEAGRAGENAHPLGNILILSEDADSSDPDDDARGGTTTFTFDTPATVLSVDVLDVDCDEVGGWIRTYDAGGGLISESPILRRGNNGFQTVEVGAENVSRMDVYVKSSGAITGLKLAGECGELINTARAVGHPIDPEGFGLPVVTDVDDWTVELICQPPEPTASLGDFVWRDKDVDGRQDADEPGIAGVAVNLLDGGGSLLASTTTDASGLYEFTSLPAGTYVVEIDEANFTAGAALANFIPTLRHVGGAAGDSDGARSLSGNVSGPVGLADGEHDPTIDFGYFLTCIDLVKTGPASACVGDTITYHFRVENCGDVVLHGGAQVYDEMLNPHGNHLIWSGVLQPGDVVEFDRTYTVASGDLGGGQVQCWPPAPTPLEFELVNTATATGHPIDPTGCALPVVTDVDRWTVQVEACQAGGEGCTPGYWKQPHHFDNWVGYSPWDRYDHVFGVNAPGCRTLLDALRLRGGGEKALARHATAALLNAAHPGVDYPYSETEVLHWVRQAYDTGRYEQLKDKLEAANELGCEDFDAPGGADQGPIGHVLLDGREEFSRRRDAMIVEHSDAYLVDEGTVALTFNTDRAWRRQGIFSKDSRGYDDGGHLEIFVKRGRVRVRLQSNNRSYWLKSRRIRSDRDYELAFTFGSGGMKLYLDGELVDSNGYTGGLGRSSGGSGNREPIVIGASAARSRDGRADRLRNAFRGEIANVVLADRALTPAELDGGVLAAPSGAEEAESGPIVFEAEDFDDISGDWGVYEDGDASGGEYLMAANGTGNHYGGPRRAGEVSYDFTLAADGTFQVLGLADGTSGRSDSFWVSVDDGEWLLWDVARSRSGFEWDSAHDRGSDRALFDLAAGDHTLRIRVREDGTRLDKIMITDDLEAEALV
jgi:hypothetical protein